jgi:crotonobetaine/carnitine-CoA ligase
MIDPVELSRHLAADLPHYMVPRYIEFLSELPRSATNKVRRAALKSAPYGASLWDRKQSGVSLRELAAAR